MFVSSFDKMAVIWQEQSMSQGIFYRAVPHKMCSSKKIYAVLMKKLCRSKDYYLVIDGYSKVNSSKNGGFRYEMIGGTQPEKEFLEIVAAIYAFSLKASSLIPPATIVSFFNSTSLDFMCSS